MNTNPGGNTIIIDAYETTSDANGEFERFRAPLNGLVPATPKTDIDREHETPTGSA